MKHKWYDVIVAIAEGKAVERNYDNGGWEDYIEGRHCSPLDVIDDCEWRIKKEPVIEVKYYFKEGDAYYTFQPDLEKWDLKITYQDGEAIKVELPSK